jgi:predicted esterase
MDSFSLMIKVILHDCKNCHVPMRHTFITGFKDGSNILFCHCCQMTTYSNEEQNDNYSISKK